MKTINNKIESHIENVISFIELTEGKGGLSSMMLEGGIESALAKYNAAYEAFITKYLNAPNNIQEIVKEKIKLNVFVRSNTSKSVSKIRTLLNA